MFNSWKTGAFSLAFFAMAVFFSGELNAAARKSYTPKSYSSKSYNKKSYSKKAPLAGFGKPSKVNGLPKTKITSGHLKRTEKGYTYVNPYARSK